ncbi:hypothetical protein BOX15_Mlig008306g1 [Macrostomum lignano]|uniref:WSC domain-containing protein n=1 Tax=Macrostomum lignano TaxID=282301 RepID=A0A267GZP9_9PLAT|nr:hypothetical protein BOX15_Mlig008306g1 [Macrostomum lignano]
MLYYIFFRNDSKMEASVCVFDCQSSRMKYFGLQSNQCFCGNVLSSVPMSDDECHSRCPGNKKETCGGLSAMSVYRVPSVMVPLVPAPSRGCYVFVYGHKLLSIEVKKNFEFLSQQVCASECLARGKYSFFGLAWGNRCFCGNQINRGTALPSNKIFCRTQCKNFHHGELCGGDGQMEIFDLVAVTN